MAVKSDRWIKRMAEGKKIIEPFVDHQVRDGVISYGLSSYGYDMRLSDQFRIPKPDAGKTLDPKTSTEDQFTDFQGKSLTLEPGQFVLGRSVEYFRIPRNIVTITYGKSTYARAGVIVNITPLEPEWEGYVTMMIANTGFLPVTIHGNEGIAQVLFLESDEVCAVSYADKKGKYQAQKKITHTRL